MSLLELMAFWLALASPPVQLGTSTDHSRYRLRRAGRLSTVTAAVLDENLVREHAVAPGRDDRRRVLRDCGHQLRAARRRSGLKPAFARSTCRVHTRRAPRPASPQVRSGDYDTGHQIDGGVVCLANGTTKPIRDVHVGDSVLATDPATGKTTARTVTATMAHDDNDLLDLTIRDGDGHEGVLKTTDHHRVWDVTRNAWVLAADLAVGDQLREPDGTTAFVVTLTVTIQRDLWRGWHPGRVVEEVV